MLAYLLPLAEAHQLVAPLVHHLVAQCPLVLHVLQVLVAHLLVVHLLRYLRQRVVHRVLVEAPQVLVQLHAHQVHHLALALQLQLVNHLLPLDRLVLV